MLIRSAGKFEIYPPESLFVWRLNNNGVMECVQLAVFQGDGGRGMVLRHLVVRILTASL